MVTDGDLNLCSGTGAQRLSQGFLCRIPDQPSLAVAHRYGSRATRRFTDNGLQCQLIASVFGRTNQSAVNRLQAEVDAALLNIFDIAGQR